jgi:hypothetical protein
MQPIQPRSKRTRILVLSLSIFVLLALIASFGGCNREPVNRLTPQAQASPTPTPQGTPPTKTDGDTPIVVKGGGSIDLDFDEAIFAGAIPTCTTCKITSVELEQIRDKGQSIPQTPIFTQCLPTPLPNPIPQIKVQTLFGIANVNITSGISGVTIDFSEGSYPGVIDQCGDPRKHHSEATIIGVKVGDKTCEGCTKWKRCKVIIKYSK